MKRVLSIATIAMIPLMPANAGQNELAPPNVESVKVASLEAEAVASAVTAASAAPVAPAVPAKPLKLNSGTPIKLVMTHEVNSSTHKEGDQFKLTVMEDVKANDIVVIPRGTPATGEVTWRTGKGAFGKSGKMEFSISSIDVDGQQIPVTGDYRQEGEGNTIATGVGILAVGPLAGFITGKRARVPAGRELMSQMAQSVEFTADGALAPSFDSNAAMKAALSGTPLGQCKLEANALENDKKRAKAIKKCFRKRME